MFGECGSEAQHLFIATCCQWSVAFCSWGGWAWWRTDWLRDRGLSGERLHAQHSGTPPFCRCLPSTLDRRRHFSSSPQTVLGCTDTVFSVKSGPSERWQLRAARSSHGRGELHCAPPSRSTSPTNCSTPPSALPAPVTQNSDRSSFRTSQIAARCSAPLPLPCPGCYFLRSAPPCLRLIASSAGLT